MGSAAINHLRPGIASQVDQLTRVLGAAAAGLNDLIVAGTLTFDARAMKRIPRQGMEPITGGGQAADHLKCHVATL